VQATIQKRQDKATGGDRLTILEVTTKATQRRFGLFGPALKGTGTIAFDPILGSFTLLLQPVSH